MFKGFVCVGDSVSYEIDGLTFIVRLHMDDDCSPGDYDCYSPDDINRWNNGDWFFGGLSVSVYLDDHLIAGDIVGLWSLECNVTNDNDHLNYEATLLVEEARVAVKPIIRDLVARLNNHA